MKEVYMNLALIEAEKAYKQGEVPIGAVIVKDGKILAKAHNTRNKSKNAVNHAEILAIEKACKRLKDWRLENAEIYVTLEPCPMCAGAIIQSRIKKVYIGAMDEKTGACGSVLNLLSDYKFNHVVEVESGFLKEECEKMLKDFFKLLRKIK